MKPTAKKQNTFAYINPYITSQRLVEYSSVASVNRSLRDTRIVKRSSSIILSVIHRLVNSENALIMTSTTSNTVNQTKMITKKKRRKRKKSERLLYIFLCPPRHHSTSPDIYWMIRLILGAFEIHY